MPVSSLNAMHYATAPGIANDIGTGDKRKADARKLKASNPTSPFIVKMYTLPAGCPLQGTAPC